MHLSLFFLDLIPFLFSTSCFAFADSHLRFCSAECWSRENLFGSGVLGFCGLLSRLISLWCLIWFWALVFGYINSIIKGMMKENRLCRLLALPDSDVWVAILFRCICTVLTWRRGRTTMARNCFFSVVRCVCGSVMERVCFSSLAVSSLISLVKLSCFSFNSFVFFSLMCCCDGMKKIKYEFVL